MFDRGRIRVELAEVLAARQRNALFRVLVPLLVAAASVACFGRPSVVRLWAWALAYAGAQTLEYRRNRKLLGRVDTISDAQTAAALASFLAMGLLYAAGCVVVLASQAPFAPMLTVLMLTGGLLNNIVASRRSLEAFIAQNGAHIAVLVLIPLAAAAKGMTAPIVGAVALGGALVSVSAVLAWRAQAVALQAQAASQAELALRRTEAEATAESRAAFTAAVSHELRTPLSAIHAAAAALEVRSLSPQHRESAATIADASRLMRRLLDDLLDLAKLEAGRMAVEAAPFDLHALIHDTVRLWAMEARGRGLELGAHGVEVLPRHVLGDALRIRQVLNNLLSNGLKFTAAGEVRLEVEAEPQEMGRWRLRLAVADTGEGLDAQALERLFRPFEQASAAVAASYGGTGLGLAISRELARLMGGGLTAAPRAAGVGARFVLDLSLEACADPALTPGALPTTAARDGRARILVVDDHPLGREAARVLLGLRGDVVRVCAGGAEALAILAADEVDLILTDLHMQGGGVGGLDGCDLARRLRANDGPNRDVAILAVSGAVGLGVAEACAAAGMNGFVAKPLEPRQLYAAVDAALARGASAAASRALSAASSFNSHSHTVSTVQPPAANAA